MMDFARFVFGFISHAYLLYTIINIKYMVISQFAHFYYDSINTCYLDFLVCALLNNSFYAHNFYNFSIGNVSTIKKGKEKRKDWKTKNLLLRLHVYNL